ncbi:Asp-tRNA(Asn)/Glu-tRNA(Gln) amidotransferase subunit GatC [Gammaproteobacteria bacterium]|jgi:aspartyl-tRNA(Asn)/glutamyl-tRNA(Gln) amidotransferase subunit C|nr:Asp-tRNA(Asn)/Glu-tRNA(Gln) amidotransferase subunit GatC [SAR86 cluster bacterium]MDA8781352.1 Asp-tRNA(Asn)/Glu-tRNA(Gln) amidotransferase subunit GatC [Gammaproteobacteria bacterium]MBL6701549.1 Asp-tRNA(Asn)/Glu-tRNA(Gln) amidotransferase subunit GatC [SAR86 cluster bacterium]MDA9140791.1 Asp-tRNA(Asn)/Glu-tRNA(Gln) amidotransferase subunit GatC [Gammaproteobacteria bacterium]MDA9800277.1 Asp-tRNA(Asn)/Glu-tRNA(Gln) amidotransferase subunit GatC [Gammaproteobacteria bacterium]
MDQETVRTICYLARLEIDENKSEKIQKDLETIIDLIGSLQTIDTSDVEPLYSPLEMTALMHEDIEKSDNKKEKFLENAAASNEDYFLVPRVVE